MMIGFVIFFSLIFFNVFFTSLTALQFSHISKTFSRSKYSLVCHFRFIFGTKITVGNSSDETISVKSLVFHVQVGSLINHLVL